MGAAYSLSPSPNKWVISLGSVCSLLYLALDLSLKHPQFPKKPLGKPGENRSPWFCLKTETVCCSLSWWKRPIFFFLTQGLLLESDFAVSSPSSESAKGLFHFFPLFQTGHFSVQANHNPAELKEKAIYKLESVILSSLSGACKTARRYTGTCGGIENALINLVVITKKKSCAYACRGILFSEIVLYLKKKETFSLSERIGFAQVRGFAKDYVNLFVFTQWCHCIACHICIFLLHTFQGILHKLKGSYVHVFILEVLGMRTLYKWEFI